MTAAGKTLAVPYSAESTDGRTATFVRRLVADGDWYVSSTGRELLVAYGVAGGAAIVMLDPVTGMAGLLHALLPCGAADPERARRLPSTFVDRGIEALVAAMVERGARRERLVARLVGCTDGELGKRNFVAAVDTLLTMGIPLEGQRVGGRSPLTVVVQTATGMVRVRGAGRDEKL